MIRIELDGDREHYRPGQTLAGRVRWDFAPAPERIEVHLLWYTEGKGSRDVGKVGRQVIESPEAQGQRPFRFELPAGPYSFRGRLISLKWAVEAVAGGDERSAQRAIVVSPAYVPLDITTRRA